MPACDRWFILIRILKEQPYKPSIQTLRYGIHSFPVQPLVVIVINVSCKNMNEKIKQRRSCHYVFHFIHQYEVLQRKVDQPDSCICSRLECSNCHEMHNSRMRTHTHTFVTLPLWAPIKAAKYCRTHKPTPELNLSNQKETSQLCYFKVHTSSRYPQWDNVVRTKIEKTWPHIDRGAGMTRGTYFK